MSDSFVDVKTAYERVCDAHDGIADFRAKLLALLPLGSGAGIFLLLRDNGIGRSVTPHLIAVGVFGAVVTLGLFAYELRGIQKCKGLIECAKRLETALLPMDLREFGAFRFRQEGAWDKRVGAEGAALLIYPAVFSAWIYLAAFAAVGAAGSPSWLIGLVPALAALASFWVALEGARGVASVNQRDLEARLKEIEGRLGESAEDGKDPDFSPSGPSDA